MKKNIKTLGILLLILVSIPFYFRNQGAVDHQLNAAWNATVAWWHYESPETKNLKRAFTSNPMTMGNGGKSAGDLREEVIRKSEERIDAQENKDVKPDPQKN